MKKYEKYKESGIQWIGQVPEHWEVCKARYFSTIEHGQAYKPDDVVANDGVLVLRACNIQDGKLSLADCVLIKDSQIVSSKLVEVGDIIICSTNGSLSLVGKSMLIETPIQASFGSFMMRMSTNQNARFVNYQLGVIVDYFRGTFATTTINQLTIETLNSMQFLLPPLSEQQAIAEYLDKKTGKIDESIEALEAQKADLQKYRTSVISETVTRGLDAAAKMKDSGVEWIGEIPDGWSLVPLKFLLKEGMMYGANESAESDNRDWPRYIRITDIDDKGGLKEDTFKSLSPEKAKDYMLEKGDILFARSGATVGKTYLYNEYFQACFAGYLIKAKCGERLLPQYLLRYTQSNPYECWKSSIYIQSTIQNIGADKYNLLPIPVPPLSEQQAIAEYLDKKTAKIDESIALIDAQIADLQAYRSAVISEAVTGKVKVS